MKPVSGCWIFLALDHLLRRQQWPPWEKHQRLNREYLIRIAELESQLRQKDQQLSLLEETEAFLRSALARAADSDRKTAPDAVRYPF